MGIEKIKEKIKNRDLFGKDINFTYKNGENFKTLTGGIVSIGLILITIAYAIYCLAQFIAHREIAVFYYKKEFIKDNLDFVNQKLSFAVQASCENEKGKIVNIEDYLKLRVYYTNSIRKENRTKEKIPILLKKCEYDDFHDVLKNDLDKNEIINKYYCIPFLKDHKISGTYADSNFSYYEIELYMKETHKLENVTKLLYENDCKLTMYFNDVKDIDDVEKNHESPYFLNSKFIQLSPIDYSKLNAYFQIKEFNIYNNLVLNTAKKREYLGFSFLEDYGLYKGLDRNKINIPNEIDDSKKYAKIFLRADETRTIYKKKYQKLTELLADFWSPIDLISVILSFIFTKYNEIFFLQGIIQNIYRMKEDDIKNRERFKEIMNKSLNKEAIDQYNNMNSNKILTNNCFNKIETSTSKVNTMVLTTPKTSDLNTDFDQSTLPFPQSSNKSDCFSELKKKNMLFNKLCCCFIDKNESKIDEIEELYNSKMDIFNYLRYLHLIKITNSIIFNEDENYFMNFVSSPSFEAESQDIFGHITNNENNYEINTFWLKLSELLTNNKKTANERKISKEICTNIDNIINPKDPFN